MNQSVALVFDGKTFDAEKDGPRLTSEFEAVKRIMHDGRWHTLAGIKQLIEARLNRMVSETGVSARKSRHGSCVVERRRVNGGGLHEYRLVQIETKKDATMDGAC